MREHALAYAAAGYPVFPVHYITESGALLALTGPVERNDVGSVTNHIRSLEEPVRGLYKALSLQLIGIAEEKRPDRDYREMKNLLTAE